MLYYITYINKNQNHEGGISFVTSKPLSERGQYLERNSGQINMYIISLLLYPSNQKLVQDLGNLSHIDLSQTWFKS